MGKEEDPTPTRDVQLGLYSLVARKMAKEWKLPAKLQAAYVYPRNADEREFRDDHAELEQATKEWLAVAHGLLAEHSFPPSPSKDDCKYCPFRVDLRRPGPRARRRRGGRGRRGRLLLAQGGTEGGERTVSANTLPPPPDEKHRLAAVASRGENLLVDAGAGTGKTTLLVRRLVEMVAPSNDAAPAVSLDRIAAVTFTRKAAGELKLRVREKLLSELAGKPSAVRRDRLAAALAAADTAFIGTIHGFADRLLRRRPVEARLSPSYEVLEDTTALVHETFETLLQASEAGTLADELADTDVDPAVANEAGEAIRLALQAEVQVETKEFDFNSSHGLDALFAAFIAHRDVPPVQGKAAPFPAARVKQKIDEFLQVARQSNGTGKGSKFLKRFADRLEAISEELDPVALYREVNAAMRWKPQKMRLKDEFVGDRAGYDAWRSWTGFEQTRQGEKEWVSGAVDAVMGPAQRWLATRLVRAFPAVVALYGKVKARHRAVDQVDLLLMLRDLLATNLEVRAEMQGLFDHVFVDEFQDTDPLQAEIILYLCEEKPVAKRWQDVVLAPGRLTLVGDPEAVDLPLPPRRHLRLRVGARHRGEGEAPARSPHRQLPVAAGAHRPPERSLRRDPRQAGTREARLRRRGRDRRQSTARRRPAGQGEEVRRGAPLPDRRRQVGRGPRARGHRPRHVPPGPGGRAGEATATWPCSPTPPSTCPASPPSSTASAFPGPPAAGRSS